MLDRVRNEGSDGIVAEEVTFRYPGAPAPAVDGVSYEFETRRVHAILGPNGSGKSTFLRILAGALEPASGTVRYGARDVRSWNRRALARRLGVVPQFETSTFPLTVLESVRMGRYPHLGPWSAPGVGDHAAVDRALELCEVASLADRSVHTLSGGEHQRVRIARALAQDPDILLLDEPTASLDIRHEMTIFELIRDLVISHGVTILLITHHINLAARYSDSILLLDRGALVAAGTPTEVITEEAIGSVYGWSVRIHSHPGPGADGGAPQVVPLGRSVEDDRPR